MSLAALSSLHADPNRGGTAAFFGLGHSERYRRIPRSTLQARNLDRRISSARAFTSSSVDTLQVLFGSPVPFVTFRDYTGLYQQVGNPKGASSSDTVNLGFLDDRATSGLLIGTRRRPEFRQSFRGAFLNEWRSTIDGELAGSQASRDGDPTMTWEMFPSGISHLDNDLTYLRIRQDLHISVPWWPDYKAWIQYHLRLFITGGNLRGFVARWEYWVESGIKSGAIGDRLRPKVIAGMDTINGVLGDRLSDFDGFNLRDVYYLPGNQTGSGAPDQTGTTWDDVTIVVEL